MQNKNLVNHLLAIEQIVENDFFVPSYLGDVLQKPKLWIQITQVAADAEGPHTVYTIDCKTIRMRFTETALFPQCMTTNGKTLTRIVGL